MNIKHFFFFIAMLAIYVSVPVFGQDESDVDERAVAPEPRAVVHRLSWHPVDYALRYEAVVEVKTVNDEWVEVTRIVTRFSDTFIDTPLFIGTYRFMVIVYDLLGYLGAESDWLGFEVRPGPYTEEPVLIEEQLYIEQPHITEEPAPIEIEAQDILDLQSIFEEPEVITELEPERSERSIFRIEVVYQPLFILPLSDFNEAYSSSLIQPIGFGLRLSALPVKLNQGFFGIEINPSVHIISNYISGPSLETQIVNLPVSIMWHFILNSNTALEFRIGFGLIYLNHSFNLSHGSALANIGNWNASLQAGISYNYFFNENLFLNAGLDYLHIFTNEMPINYLRPSLALGWWF